MESFPCPLCSSFKAPNVRFLWSHIRLVHATKPGFRIKCHLDNCARIFTNIKTYDNHLTRYHLTCVEFLNFYIYPWHACSYHFMATRTTLPEMVIPQPEQDETITEVDNSDGPTSQGSEGDSIANNSNDESESQESDRIPPLEEELKCTAANWIIKMKETCKLTQVATDEIIKGVADFNSYMVTKLYEVVKNSLEERNINISDMPELGKAFDSNSPLLNPFKGIGTYHLLLEYCKKKLRYIVSSVGGGGGGLKT